jgi:hypothetical protein
VEVDKATWQGLPGQAKRVLLEDLDQELERAYSQFRSAESVSDLRQVQGRARYLYSTLQRLRSFDRPSVQVDFGREERADNDAT